MEEAEEVLFIPTTPEDVGRWVETAAPQLRCVTGVELPQVPSLPELAVERSYVDWLGASIPVGSAFYPCCGSDLEQLPRLFGHHVSAYHFADAYQSLGGARRRRARARQTSIEHIGNVVVGSSQTETMLIEGQQAVFHYYCGDSGGEGGSGQRVLGPVGFHIVLARLLEGGLICSDGSNLGYYDDFTDRYAPWNALAGLRPFSVPVKGAQFDYFNRRFTCLATLERARPVYVWQMFGITQ